MCGDSVAYGETNSDSVACMLGFAVLSMQTKTKERDVAKQPKSHGTMVRVSFELAEALRRIAGLETQSIMEWSDKNLLSIVLKKYDEAILKKAKEIEATKKGQG